MGNELVWVEVNLGAIAANFHMIKKLLQPGIALLAVVKADAYGHGALPVAATLAAAGVDYLAVATGDEALELREGGIDAPILVLNTGLPDGQEEVLLRYGITQTVCTLELAAAIDKAACRLERRGLVHLKVETGMGRLGVAVDKLPAFMQGLSTWRGLALEGIYSHLAMADEGAGEKYSYEQYRLFRSAMAVFAPFGAPVSYTHIANSAAILHYPTLHLNMVRAGCIIYGFYPRGDEWERELLKLTPALSWKSVVVNMVGEKGGMRLIRIPVGLIHGLPRSAEAVLIGGRRVGIVRPVAIDHCVAAVPPEIAVGPGDEVVLIGRQGKEEIRAAEVAGWNGTISEEITCRLGSLPHIYSNGPAGALG